LTPQPDDPIARIDETPQITYFEDSYRKQFIGPDPKPLHPHHGGHPKRPLRRQDHARGNRLIRIILRSSLLVYAFNIKTG
jgi:hypothetical protein